MYKHIPISNTISNPWNEDVEIRWIPLTSLPYKRYFIDKQGIVYERILPRFFKVYFNPIENTDKEVVFHCMNNNKSLSVNREALYMLALKIFAIKDYKETFREIREYGGAYEISNFGTVLSYYDRRDHNVNKHQPSSIMIPVHIKSKDFNGNNIEEPYVQLTSYYAPHKQCKVAVKQLVASAFKKECNNRNVIRTHPGLWGITDKKTGINQVLTIADELEIKE